MMFIDCPAYQDHDGAGRCGLPAEVTGRFTMRSTDGPLEAAMIRCPAGHYFCGAIESLTWDRNDKHDPGPAAVTSRAGRDSRQRGHDGRDGMDGAAVRHFPAEAERGDRRPNTAPAYYLGHPAALWISAMSPRRGRTAPAHPADAVTGGLTAHVRHARGKIWIGTIAARSSGLACGLALTVRHAGLAGLPNNASGVLAIQDVLPLRP